MRSSFQVTLYIRREPVTYWPYAVRLRLEGRVIDRLVRITEERTTHAIRRMIWRGEVK